MRFVRSTIIGVSFTITLGLCGAAGAGAAASSANLGRGLNHLVDMYDRGSPQLAPILKRHITQGGRDPLVHVHLSPGANSSAVLTRLSSLGFRLQETSELDSSLLEGYLPLSSARAAGAVPGVKSVVSVLRPKKFAGAVQSQAVAVERADKVQAHGITGHGIKLGALSDSYNALSAFHPNAADDVASGDLPPDVVIIQDDTNPADQGADEGRAILQLMHDVAPGAKEAFATANFGPANFANNILKLRRKFGADIIVDDVGYFDEPMYSDGLIAQAVDKVVSEGAAYFSSAGNNGFEAYEAEYEAVPFADAKALVAEGKSNVDLAALEKLGIEPLSIQNFRNPDGTTTIAEPLTSIFGGDAFVLQWDEPFDLGKVRTDYNVFFFDASGKFIDPSDPKSPIFVTNDDNLATDEAVEVAFLGGPGLYQVVIGKMNKGPASLVKYVIDNSQAESVTQNAPSVYGHPAAKGAEAVAAMYYPLTAWPEGYSSPGPVTILFDNKGNRLHTPDIRLVPQITGIDGVDTTFFGFDSDGNGLPNFFGTSAAAPDVAAVGALVLQASGGPGSVGPHALYQRLQNTATRVPLSIDRVDATAVSGSVIATATGSFPAVTTYWGLQVEPFESQSVKSVSIDISSLGFFWVNPTAAGAGFKVGSSHGIKASDIKSVTRNKDATILTITFKPHTFFGGDSFSFSEFAVPNALPFEFAIPADLFEGARVNVTLNNGKTSTGVFQVAPKAAINLNTGAGLVNAEAAVQASHH